MPPRKSDQRKSEPAMARFELAEEHTEVQNGGIAQPATPSDAQSKAPLQKTPVTQDKEKDKETEKEKEKEKDKNRDHKDSVTIEDLTLPKSIIARLAKGALPPNTQIQANAMLALNRSATVIINYLASHANEHTMNANRKTISPDDVFKALADVDMDFMREHLEREFEVFNSIQTEKRTSYRQKVRAAKHTSDGPSNPGEGDDTDMADASINDTTLASEASGPRASKKARVEAPVAGGVAAVAGAGAAAAAAAEDAEDADTEEEQEIEDDDEDEEVEEEEEDDDAQDEERSGDETQDALEERGSRPDGDEAVDDDESD